MINQDKQREREEYLEYMQRMVYAVGEDDYQAIKEEFMDNCFLKKPYPGVGGLTLKIVKFKKYQGTFWRQI